MSLRNKEGLRLMGVSFLVFTLLVAVGIVIVPAAAADRLQVPILSLLSTEHPRILATAADFTRLKELLSTEPLLAAWYGSVERQARLILGQPAIMQSSKLTLEPAREILSRICQLGLVYQISGDPRLAARAWKELEPVAALAEWRPSHFLTTAETTHSLAIAYDWFYQIWTDEQRRILRDAIVRNGLLPALSLYRGQRGWVTQHWTNWNMVCNGGIALGALAIADEEPELAEEILHGSLASIQLPLPGFSPDGGWHEGTAYWRYATDYLVTYMAALDVALGTDFGLSGFDGLSDIGLFPIYLTGPTNLSFNFGDATARREYAPHLFWLATRYDRPEYAWWQRSTVDNNPPIVAGPSEVLWYDPQHWTSPEEWQLPLDKHFRKVEVATLRSSWDDPEAVFVGFKAGDNSASHTGLDLGTFVLDALGYRWAEQLGPENYTVLGSGSAPRTDYYRIRAEGQNQVVINPSLMPDQNPKAVAPISHFGAKAHEAMAIADLTSAYPGATRVWRGVALIDDRRQVVIQDEIALAEMSSIWWFMHTKAEISIGDDGRQAVLRRGNKRLEARILSPEGAQFAHLPARPLPTSPDPQGQGSNAGFSKLAVHLEEEKDVRLTILLTPLAGGEYAPVLPPLYPLAAWIASLDAEEELWSFLPRVNVTVESPLPGTTIRDGEPARFAVDTGGLAVESTQVQLGAMVLYSGTTLPPSLTLYTRGIDDGEHVLCLAMNVAEGVPVRHSVPITILNWWETVDNMKAPVTFFGDTVDFTMTSRRSDGWRYVKISPSNDSFFGDDERQTRMDDTTEYLVWEGPNLREFVLTVYLQHPEALNHISLETSNDGETWEGLAFASDTVAQSASGWKAMELAGSVDIGNAYFRVTLHESGSAPDTVQIGRVVLRGRLTPD